MRLNIRYNNGEKTEWMEVESLAELDTYFYYRKKGSNFRVVVPHSNIFNYVVKD